MFGKSVYKSVTDERLVIDVLCPGFGADDIKVKAAKVNGGDTFKLIIAGTYTGRTNKDGDRVPRLASEKSITNFKYTLSDDEEFGDPLWRSHTFNSKDYDLDNLVWDVQKGVARISIPKTDLAKGKEIKAVPNADADSTGTTAKDDADAAEVDA